MKDSIDAINERFLELRPNQESLERARSLKPMHIRTDLGRDVFLFEGTEIDKLTELGEVRPPFIADLFMAIMDKTKSEGQG
jgi:hypothetical protein